jgi:hypothetical protein
MKAPNLAHAYVSLDRFVFFQLRSSSAFETFCAHTKQRLIDNEGLGDFEELCQAGAERDELLWLLKGCEGLPGFTRMIDLFGRSAPQLTRVLAAMEEAASVIENMQRHTFGLLARHALSSSGIGRDIRAYVTLARAARKDFGHRSHWFLNIAKARLVIHVAHKTAGNVCDKEVSGLIAAVTGTDYNAAAQSQWRHAHDELVRDRSLDPYTTMGIAGREQVQKTWEELAMKDPELFEACAVLAADYKAIEEGRHGIAPNRKVTKT